MNTADILKKVRSIEIKTTKISNNLFSGFTVVHLKEEE